MNRHWTTGATLKNNVLRLFDCSHEAEAVLNVHKDSFVTSVRDICQEKLLYIQPNTIRLLRLPL